MNICPVCKDGYKPFEDDMCRKCKDKQDPARVELREIAKIKKKKSDKVYRHKKYLEAKEKHLISQKTNKNKKDKL
jgi:hypothetical protein